MKWLLIVLAFAAGLGLGLWYGKRHAPRNTFLMLDSVGKVDVSPARGEVIHWASHSGSKVNPTFTDFGPNNNLCREGVTPPNDVCTVMNKGNFPYTCEGCIDPVIGPGSSTGPMHPPPPPEGERPTAPPIGIKRSEDASETIAVACVSGTAKVVSYSGNDKDHVHPGELINWASGPITGTITNLQSSQSQPICQGGTTSFDTNGGACQIVSGWTTATYNINLASCAQGTGSLTFAPETVDPKTLK